jgi:hypothetical protein
VHTVGRLEIVDFIAQSVAPHPQGGTFSLCCSDGILRVTSGASNGFLTWRDRLLIGWPRCSHAGSCTVFQNFPYDYFSRKGLGKSLHRGTPYTPRAAKCMRHEMGPFGVGWRGSSLVCANTLFRSAIGWGSRDMQRPINPLVPLAELRQTRAWCGSRSRDWPLQHHL